MDMITASLHSLQLAQGQTELPGNNNHPDHLLANVDGDFIYFVGRRREYTVCIADAAVAVNNAGGGT